ncbi:MAG: type II and III secretion system protein [Armatimonadetes bacterium]|nr:type II and III secretion system protein [Armatimonadota bacterium]
MEQIGLQVVATICLLSLDPQLAIGIRAARTHATSEGVLVMEGVPAEVASWLAATPRAADRDRSAPSLRTIRGALPLHTTMACDLNWPDDSPRYYLEKEADDLYRRVRLVDREGYSVELRLVGEAPDLRVEVTARRREFTKGTYDETIKALVGRPDLLKTLCTTTAPVVPGDTTVVVWTRPVLFAGDPLTDDLDARVAQIERAQNVIRRAGTPWLGGAAERPSGELPGPSPTGLAIILSAEQRGGSAAPPVPDETTDADLVQIEVACRIVDVVAGTPPWKQLTEADDVASKLTELLEQGALRPQSEPRVSILNNMCATTSFWTTRPSMGSAEAPGEEPGLRPKPLDVGSRLSFTPRVLEDGHISLAIEAEFSDFAGWIAGEDGKRLPVMGTHRTPAHLVTGDGEPTVMSLFEAKPTREGDNQTRGVQAIQRMLLITPRVLNPEALRENVRQKLGTPVTP